MKHQKKVALITADFAKSMGKEVYVPPYEINSSSGKGSNKLLLEGAKIFLEPSQLLLDNGCRINPTNLGQRCLEINLITYLIF